MLRSPWLIGLRWDGTSNCFFCLILWLSSWLLAPCVVSRPGSVTSQSSARASLPTAPPTSTRWMAPPVKVARPTATTACASPTKSSASSCGVLVRTLLESIAQSPGPNSSPASLGGTCQSSFNASSPDTAPSLAYSVHMFRGRQRSSQALKTFNSQSGRMGKNNPKEKETELRDMQANANDLYAVKRCLSSVI